LLALVASANAQSPREELQQMVEQLQQTPNDNALREKIVKLALTLKPEPVLPPEAERRMVRGSAAFKGATSVTGYQDAVKEFEHATLAAPWSGDAYFNLGVSQDKAENYEAALRSLKLARLASPDSKEIQTLIYEVEYRQEKINSPEAQAARQKQKEEELVRSLDGVRFDCPQLKDAATGERKEHWLVIEGSQLTAWIKMLQIDPDRARVDHVGQVFKAARLPIMGALARDGGPNWEKTYRITTDRIIRTWKMDGHSEPSVTCIRQ
jgi:tetratricopeptide (TPR) repeat protein